MAIKSPQQNEFEKAEECKKISHKCRCIILAASILKIMLEVTHLNYVLVINSLAVLLLTFTILHMFIKYRYSRHFRKAEDDRRKGFLDKSFGTKMAKTDSEDYYDTEDIACGYKKLLANLHENSFYSSKISEKMIDRVQGKLIVIFAFFVIITVTNIFKVQVAIAIINALMAMDVIGEYSSLKYYNSEIQDVFEGCIDIWGDLESLSSANINDKIIAKILKVYSKYETTLAYESIMLDSKIYNEMNGSLMDQWEDLKKRYNMTQ